MQSHLQLLVAVLVVHVVDDVQSVYVHTGQPTHHIVVAFHNLVVIQILGGDGAVLGADLLTADFVHTAVDGVQKALGQVSTGAEELHLLADTHGGYAAGDGVVVTVGEAHQIVVLVLNGRGLNGGLGAEALEVLGQIHRPQNGQVRLGSRAQVVQGVQVTVGHLGNEVTSADAHAADGLGYPLGVAGEQCVVLGSTGKLDQTQLHDEVVHQLLQILFRKGALFEVTLCVNIQEGRGTAQAHSGAVLLLNCGQVAEVQPLDRFLGVGSGLGDIVAVGRCHLLQILQRTDLLGELLAVTDHIGIHSGAGTDLLLLLVLDQTVHAVQSHTAVVTDDTAAAVGIRQTGDDVAGTAGTHLGGVCVKHAGVVSLAVGGEELLHLRIDGISVVGAGLLCHTDTAVRHHRTLEGLIGLEADDLFFVLVQIAGAMGGDGGDDAGVHIENTAGFSFLPGQLHDLFPQIKRILGRALEELFVAVVGCIVMANKTADVDLAHPSAAFKSAPTFIRVFVLHSSHSKIQFIQTSQDRLTLCTKSIPYFPFLFNH